MTRPLPADWEKRRQLVIERDGGICTEPGCGRLAIDVDHTIPRAFGGSDELSNLKSKCRMHHGQKTARECRGDGFGFAYGEES